MFDGTQVLCGSPDFLDDLDRNLLDDLNGYLNRDGHLLDDFLGFGFWIFDPTVVSQDVAQEVALLMDARGIDQPVDVALPCFRLVVFCSEGRPRLRPTPY